MSEQARFQEWWESKGTNSVILRAQAWSAWLARAEAEKPPQCADDGMFLYADDGTKYTEQGAQPQKTRVRLWIPSVLNSSVRQNTVIVQDQPANPLLWQEIHHDSEGFFVEGS